MVKRFRKPSIGTWLALLCFAVLVGCGTTSGDSTGVTSGEEGASQANPAAPTVFKLGHPVSDQAVSGVTATAFANGLDKETGGMAKVEVYGGAVLGNEISMLEQVQIGSLELASTSLSAFANFVPELKVLDMPFLFRDYDHVYKALDGPIGQEFAEIIESKGFKLLSFGEVGFKVLSNSQREIREPADLKGLKIRTSENNVIVDTFKSFGADPTPVPFPEVYTSVQQGVVDGVDMAYVPFNDTKLYEVQKYLTELNLSYNAAVLVMNLDLFNSLDPKLQETLLELGEIHTKEQRELTSQATDAIKQASRDNGVQIVEVNEIDFSSFLEVVRPVYDKYGEYDEIIAKIQDVK